MRPHGFLEHLAVIVGAFIGHIARIAVFFFTIYFLLKFVGVLS